MTPKVEHHINLMAVSDIYLLENSFTMDELVAISKSFYPKKKTKKKHKKT